MKELQQTMDRLREKLPGWRKRGINEMTTRKSVIDPILEGLEWAVGDPDEVQLEYVTVDGKSIDYALMKDDKPVVVIEAKALNDTLDDVKGITQVVGYAANNGIDWCVLTNGVKWKVYRSDLKCPAPQKLVFEVCIDPPAAAAGTQNVAEQLWLLSKEKVRKGDLDEAAKAMLMDKRVERALRDMMEHPDRGFLGLVKKAMADKDLKFQEIRESLARVWGRIKEAKGNGDVRPVLPPDGPRDATETQKRRYEFWSQFLKRAHAKTEFFSGMKTPTTDCWLHVGTGVAGAGCSVVVLRSGAKVEIWINRGPQSRVINKKIFDALFSQRSQIERECGFSLEWERQDEKQHSVVFKPLARGSLDDESSWPALQDEMIDTSVRMIKVFGPRLKEIAGTLRKSRRTSDTG